MRTTEKPGITEVNGLTSPVLRALSLPLKAGLSFLVDGGPKRILAVGWREPL